MGYIKICNFKLSFGGKSERSMGSFYIDDSVHDSGEFILCACVYTSEDIEPLIADIILANGFNPDNFEFKSSSNYTKEPERVKVRDAMKQLIHRDCRFGIVVLPRNERQNVGVECLNGVRQFITHNTELEKPIAVYLDQGMFNSIGQAREVVEELPIDAVIHVEQNSMKTRGIQLADLIAHMASIQLKAAMGLVTKMIRVGKEDGFDPEDEIELSLEMFAHLRYSLSNDGIPPDSEDYYLMRSYNVGLNGIYIAKTCSPSLREIVIATFGKVYLGCLH